MSATRTHRLAWTGQILLAALFLFAGIVKLRMPAAVLAGQTGLPGEFLHFIAVAELAGALGLVLPGLFGIRRELTPLAAAGLAIIMTGATIVSVLRMGPAAAVMPFVVGVLLVLVIRARRDWLAGPARPGSAHQRGAALPVRG